MRRGFRRVQVERGHPQNHKWEARFRLDVITGAVQLQLEQQAEVFQCYYRVNTIQIATSESFITKTKQRS